MEFDSFVRRSIAQLVFRGGEPLLPYEMGRCHPETREALN
jgi:hypothetical protein